MDVIFRLPSAKRSADSDDRGSVIKPMPTLAVGNKARMRKPLAQGCDRVCYLGDDGWLYKVTTDESGPYQNRNELRVSKILRTLPLPEWFAVPECWQISADDHVIAAEYIAGHEPHGVFSPCDCEIFGLPNCYTDLTEEAIGLCDDHVDMEDLFRFNLKIHDDRLWFIDLGCCEVKDKRG